MANNIRYLDVKEGDIVSMPSLLPGGALNAAARGLIGTHVGIVTGIERDSQGLIKNIRFMHITRSGLTLGYLDVNSQFYTHIRRKSRTRDNKNRMYGGDITPSERWRRWFEIGRGNSEDIVRFYRPSYPNDDARQQLLNGLKDYVMRDATPLRISKNLLRLGRSLSGQHHETNEYCSEFVAQEFKRIGIDIFEHSEQFSRIIKANVDEASTMILVSGLDEHGNVLGMDDLKLNFQKRLDCIMNRRYEIWTNIACGVDLIKQWNTVNNNAKVNSILWLYENLPNSLISKEIRTKLINKIQNGITKGTISNDNYGISFEYKNKKDERIKITVKENGGYIKEYVNSVIEDDASNRSLMINGERKIIVRACIHYKKDGSVDTKLTSPEMLRIMQLKQNAKRARAKAISEIGKARDATFNWSKESHNRKAADAFIEHNRFLIPLEQKKLARKKMQ